MLMTIRKMVLERSIKGLNISKDISKDIMIRDIFPSIPQIKGLFKYLVLYVLKDNELHG